VPNLHAVAVIAITVMVFYLYTRPWIRMELVSLLLLASLLIVFYAVPFVTDTERVTDVSVLQAFGHPALVAICSLMILGRGLTMTGALEPAVRLLARVWGLSRWLGLLLTLVLAGLTSGFINDTPVLVLMLPMLLSLAQRTGYPASKTLMPVNFAILIGGTLTTIGTSTNLLVLSIAADLGMEPVQIFDFTATAALGFLVALPYLWLLAPRLLPDTTVQAPPARQFEARILVTDQATKLLGRQIEDVARPLGRPLPVVAVFRDDTRLDPLAVGALAAGDALMLRDTPDGLREVAEVLQAELYSRDGAGRFVEQEIANDDVTLAEAVIGTESSLVGRTLSDTRFAEQHAVVVVGLQRGTEELLRDGRAIGDVPLAAGDVLLVQGPNARVSALKSDAHLLMLESSLQLPRSPLAPWALGIMIVVIAVAATRLLPIHVAAFLGVIAMLVRGCISLDGLGRALSAEVILLVASSIALGQSLVSTGAAEWIAQGVSLAVDALPAAAQIAAFMAFAAALTNFVSNSAAAAVGTPIAVATATQLGAPLEPFVLAILFGANLSFATPMAYQTNLLIMSAARYHFTDFVKVGLPLVVLMLVTLSLLLVHRYGL
jgi:di/tricarboxylate transporter